MVPVVTCLPLCPTVICCPIAPTRTGQFRSIPAHRRRINGSRLGPLCRRVLVRGDEAVQAVASRRAWSHQFHAVLFPNPFPTQRTEGLQTGHRAIRQVESPRRVRRLSGVRTQRAVSKTPFTSRSEVRRCGMRWRLIMRCRGWWDCGDRLWCEPVLTLLSVTPMPLRASISKTMMSATTSLSYPFAARSYAIPIGTCDLPVEATARYSLPTNTDKGVPAKP
jgi:hypothetical protein